MIYYITTAMWFTVATSLSRQNNVPRTIMVIIFFGMSLSFGILLFISKPLQFDFNNVNVEMFQFISLILLSMIGVFIIKFIYHSKEK